MGLLGDISGDGDETKSQPSLSKHERFPKDEYGVADAVSMHNEDISAIHDLIEAD